jgi:hypothetical protein
MICYPASPRAFSERPEAELLLSCARVRMDAERGERIQKLLQRDLDWEYILRRALYSGMMPLLYRHLRAASPGAVPGAILDQLRDHFYQVTGQNLLLTRELLGLLKLFETHGIPAIPFKGPALAAAIYGDLGFREFADLDFLVKRRDIPRAKELLISWGYRPDSNPTPAQELDLLRYHHSQVFLREQVVVEIHWRIVQRSYSFPLEPDHLWERCISIPLDGRDVLAFSPEDLLLILCAHGAKHGWDRLVWISDIAELIVAHRGMNWGLVLERAGELRCTRILFLGLFLAHDLLAASLPKDVVQGIGSDPAIRTLGRQVREHLFEDRNDPPVRAETFLFFLRARECLRDKVRHCLGLAMTPSVEDWASVLLPASLSFLYYLIRPIRVAKKLGRGVFRCQA